MRSPPARAKACGWSPKDYCEFQEGSARRSIRTAAEGPAAPGRIRADITTTRCRQRICHTREWTAMRPDETRGRVIRPLFFVKVAGGRWQVIMARSRARAQHRRARARNRLSEQTLLEYRW